MDKKILKALSLVTQLALSMAVPIFLCTFAGIGLDRLFGTSPFFLLVLILLGIGGGFRSVYILTKTFYSGEDTYIDVNKYKRKGEDKVEKRD